MADRLEELLSQVSDERSFNRFLTALRESCEWHERNCNQKGSPQCYEQNHFITHSTRDFLRSVEDWATRGDFAEGRHYGDPILRRVATMLFVGRYPIRENPDEDRDD